MSKHGWVKPLPQGAKARCGGPGMCGHCMAERIVARGCPTDSYGRCFYCAALLAGPSPSHLEACSWPPFAEKFS